jgi:hypothetical protein
MSWLWSSNLRRWWLLCKWNQNNIRKEGEWADDKKEGKGKYYQSEGGGYDG